VGTLTVLPVRTPTTVDRRTAGRAMVLAPVVGLLLAVLVLAALWLVGGGSLAPHPAHAVTVLTGGPVPRPPRFSLLSPLMAAVTAVAALALLTRGMHLDGLADTADGLGSARSPAAALETMRRGDVGPFGVSTLVLCLMLQVAALAACLRQGNGPWALVAALVVSRACLPVTCRRGVPAARPDGLGAGVAGSVGPAGLVASGALAVAALLATALIATAMAPWTQPAAAAALSGSATGWSTWALLKPVLALALPVAVSVAWVARCTRRLGGVTGDVLGSTVELAFTACLAVLALG
jgi:adenosylcobinamide-GDP ribazoletransferase